MNASTKLLERVLPASVSVTAAVAAAHPSSQILGTERQGSGVVVDGAGLILTVNYVVLGATDVEVGLLDDTRLRGAVVAQDFAAGIAVVDVGRKLAGALPLCPPAELRLGQDIFIVAAAGENKRRASDGGISGLSPFDAYWEYSLECAILTTAMNPGLGGAPLMDLLGRVAGIVSLDLSEIGRFTLAIPTTVYAEHKDELLQHGHRISRVPRAWVGFYCYSFREHVVIAGVLSGAPGEHAGLKPGDVVVAVDGQRVNGRRQLYDALWAHRPGERIALEIFRDSGVLTLSVTGGDAEQFFA